MNSATPCNSRRHFLAQRGFGLAGTATRLAVAADAARAEPAKPDLVRKQFNLLPKPSPQPPQARAMISMFMQGGPSHLDLFDRKPALEKLHMQNFPGEIKYDNAAESSAKCWYGPWKWQQHGQCGMELCELLPYLASVVDDITLVRSMRTGVNNHGQSIYALHNGRITGGRPSSVRG